MVHSSIGQRQGAQHEGIINLSAALKACVFIKCVSLQRSKRPFLFISCFQKGRVGGVVPKLPGKITLLPEVLEI